VRISRGSASLQVTVKSRLLAVVLSGKVTVLARLVNVGELPMQQIKKNVYIMFVGQNHTDQLQGYLD
jgi:hypothetical protein